MENGQIVANITKTAFEIFKKKWKSRLWILIPASVIWWSACVFFLKTIALDANLLILFFVPFIILLADYLKSLSGIRNLFWVHFAKSRGWKYLPIDSVSCEQAVLFNKGYEREAKNIIIGIFAGRDFRIFEYSFSLGTGKRKRTYEYTVFEFKFLGHFPHLYLNRKGNIYGVDGGEKICLSREFEEKFELFAPKEYEIEALQIFSPDILAYLLDSKLKYDIELADKELIIFIDGLINSREQLELEYQGATDLFKILASKLDRFKFSVIGSFSASLTN